MTFQFSATLASRDFSVALEVARGETVAILGPNGAGKSTLLALMAGLLRPDSGRAELDGTVFFNEHRPFVEPWARGVSLLSQDALLFPHLTALENVAFGPRSAGVSRTDARAEARRWLAALDAAEFAPRHPSELSGGQAQRVAIARALAAGPGLLLLDEPMAALDIAVAPMLRSALKRVLADRSAIIVTHDILDALVLADRVIVIEKGRIVEQGATREVLERPRTGFTASIAGRMLLTGMRTADGLLTTSGMHVRTARNDVSIGATAAIALSPSAVTVSRKRPENRSLNVVQCRVTDLEPRGDAIRVCSEQLAADVAPAIVADLDLDLASGDPVWFAFDSAETTLYAL